MARAATLQVVDWNNDGRHDLVAGGLDGKVRVYLNSSDGGEPELRTVQFVQDAAGDLIVPTGRSSVAVADLDGDGRKDLLLGNTEGRLFFYANQGTDVAPLFDTGEAVQADGAEIDLPGTPRSRPFVGDYDADGLPDLLVGAADGYVRLFRAATWDTPRSAAPTVDDPGTIYHHVFQIAAAAWQNRIEPTDVTGDELIVPLDALTVINELNDPQYSDPVGLLPDSTPDLPPPYLDVNGDGYCTPVDALIVINRLNAPPVAASSSFAAERIAPAAVAAPDYSAIAAAIDSIMAEDPLRAKIIRLRGEPLV